MAGLGLDDRVGHCVRATNRRMETRMQERKRRGNGWGRELRERFAGLIQHDPAGGERKSELRCKYLVTMQRWGRRS